MGVYRTIVREEIESILPQELQEQYLMEVVFAFGVLWPPKKWACCPILQVVRLNHFLFQIINAWMFVYLLSFPDRKTSLGSNIVYIH